MLCLGGGGAVPSSGPPCLVVPSSMLSSSPTKILLKDCTTMARNETAPIRRPNILGTPGHTGKTVYKMFFNVNFKREAFENARP